ncbi:helix-turn-helix domain-containing protein [Bradyrhizobium sp. McL0616]|uniref:helix-turn-helix domain-containing protein n=1 Tax=Bradyrhizobium sp. McL0616 TaxID=3415674 RepID=UPI003CE67620
MSSTDSVLQLPEPPVAMFSAPGHRDTIWSDVKGSVDHSRMIKWTGGVAATHEIGKVSGAAEVRTRSLELHFSWNSGVAEAEAESGKRVWAYKNRPRYGLVLPPGANVEFRIKEKSNYRFLAMEFDPGYLLRAAELQHLSSVEFVETWEHDHPLTWYLAEAIFEECESAVRQGLLYSETAATLLALHVARSLSNQMRPTNLLRRGGLPPVILGRACDYMNSHLGDDISLSELASVCGLSAGHFAFAFKQSTGISPHGWLRRQRIDTAKALLRSPQLSLSYIAGSVGFGNQSAFGVAFRKEMGMTPTAWRRLHWS